MTPQDYRVPGVTTLMFPVSSVNMAEQCLMITIVDDTLAEGDESFTVSLINPVGGGTQKQSTVPLYGRYVINLFPNSFDYLVPLSK